MLHLQKISRLKWYKVYSITYNLNLGQMEKKRKYRESHFLIFNHFYFGDHSSEENTSQIRGKKLNVYGKNNGKTYWKDFENLRWLNEFLQSSITEL